MQTNPNKNNNKNVTHISWLARLCKILCIISLKRGAMPADGSIAIVFTYADTHACKCILSFDNIIFRAEYIFPIWIKLKDAHTHRLCYCSIHCAKRFGFVQFRSAENVCRL